MIGLPKCVPQQKARKGEPRFSLEQEEGEMLLSSEPPGTEASSWVAFCNKTDLYNRDLETKLFLLFSALPS